MDIRVRSEMKCPECGKLCGSHDDGCKWSEQVAARYFAAFSSFMDYLARADIDKLRDTRDKLGELIAWASAYDIARRNIPGEMRAIVRGE